KDGENGFLVPAGDVDKLAEKMNLFVENPALISQFQERIKPWKSFDEHIGEMINLYEEIILKLN
ncbi:MAG: glycosyltransferase family 1 protein, partial [Candidatus Parcubacteria bacterium]|nr:glycosyltransferase family 1 protein [Candidatus Parcubacteria bacterium]